MIGFGGAGGGSYNMFDETVLQQNNLQQSDEFLQQQVDTLRKLNKTLVTSKRQLEQEGKAHAKQIRQLNKQQQKLEKQLQQQRLRHAELAKDGAAGGGVARGFSALWRKVRDRAGSSAGPVPEATDMPALDTSVGGDPDPDLEAIAAGARSVMEVVLANCEQPAVRGQVRACVQQMFAVAKRCKETDHEELTRLRAAVADMETDAEQRQSALQSTKTAFMLKEKECTETRQMVEQLRKVHATALATVEAESTERQERLENDLQARLRRAEWEHEEQLKSNKQLRKQSSTLTKRLLATQSEVQRQRGQITAQQKKLSRGETEAAKLHSQLSTMTAKKDALERRVADLEGAALDLAAVVKRERTQMRTLERMAMAQEDDMSRQWELSTLREEIRKYESQVREELDRQATLQYGSANPGADVLDPSEHDENVNAQCEAVINTIASPAVWKSCPDSEVLKDFIKQSLGSTMAAMDTSASTRWVPDNLVHTCQGCHKQFSMSRRKHHCRKCGKIFCSQCSSKRMRVNGQSAKSRVCDLCFVAMNRLSQTRKTARERGLSLMAERRPSGGGGGGASMSPSGARRASMSPTPSPSGARRASLESNASVDSL